MTEQRYSLDQLAERVEEATKRLYGKDIEHIRSGGRYRVVQVGLHADTMAITIGYTPISSSFFGRIIFNQTEVAMKFGERFRFL